MNEQTIEIINKSIQDFFETHPETNWIPAKELMPGLIQAGVFQKDEKSGLPLRKLLRSLDQENQLSLIPRLHVEREGKNSFWYFVREGAEYSGVRPKDIVTKKARVLQNRLNSEENYVINLCDEVLNEKSARQHTFEFLLGDVHRDGKTRTRLPVNAFYPKFPLVVEYLEYQDPARHETTDKLTVSGISRAEQREVYRKRKKEVMRKKQIPMVEIKYKDLTHDAQNRLSRDKESDLRIVKRLLMKFLPA